MAKKTATTIRSAIIDLLIMIVLAISVFFLYREYYQTSLINKQMNTFNSEINDDLKKIDELQNSLDDLNNQYQTMLNIEQEVINAKKAYFDEISTLENKILNNESNVKIAYLTFDDGPYYFSDDFLDVLDSYDIPATFFYLMKTYENGYYKEFSEYADGIYKRIIASGHTLGNHSASHKLGPDGIYRSVEAFMNDIQKNRDFIYNKYNYLTDVMRFPGGSNTSSLKPLLVKELDKIGYRYVDWNSSSGDGAGVLPVDLLRSNVLDNTNNKKIIVVLMHDYSENTLIALPDIIDGLSKQGYTFLPLFHDSVMCLNY